MCTKARSGDAKILKRSFVPESVVRSSVRMGTIGLRRAPATSTPWALRPSARKAAVRRAVPQNISKANAVFPEANCDRKSFASTWGSGGGGVQVGGGVGSGGGGLKAEIGEAAAGDEPVARDWEKEDRGGVESDGLNFGFFVSALCAATAG